MAIEQEEVLKLRQQLEYEQYARKKAEKTLKEKSRALQLMNDQMKEINNRIEQEVQKRTHELQSLARMPLENPEPVLRINYEGKIIFCNEAIGKLKGDLRLDDAVYSFEQFWLYMARIVKEAAKRIELDVQSCEASFQFICVPLHEEGYINVYGRDITVRKIAERQLRTTASRLTTLITNIHSGVLLEDQHRKIVLTNQLFCDFFSIPVPPDYLVGMDCENSAEQSKHLFNDPEYFVARINTILKERQLVVGEELEMTGGRILERHYIPIFENGEYLGHLWNYNDITDRKKNQYALQRSEEKYRNIIENMNLGLIEVDLEEHIVYANQSFCTMMGYAPGELLGKKAIEIFLRVDDSMGRKQMNRVQTKRQKGISDACEFLLENKDGENVWMLISGAPLYDNNKEFIGSIGIHLDISNQKQMEEDLRDAISKAQASVKTKEIFLANMSHEIRTPMNAILGMSRLLHKTPLNTQQHSFLKAITTSAENLLVIINDILDFSKIEAGKMQMEEVNFSITDVIAQVSDIVEYKAEEKGLQIRTIVDENIPKVLQGDPYRLNQILLNLAGNAVKFTMQGSVEIEARLQSVSDNIQRVKFTVTDTGIGIEAARQADIFNSFTQEDNSVTRKFGGTGLGLSICKRLIELMGSSIQVVSEKNKGTTMCFVLDFKTGEADALMKEENTDEFENTLQGSHILLVEDNEFNRMLAATILNNQGVTVTEAINGLEAIKACVQHSFDLILMDIQMPEMNGIETTIQLREQLNNHTPIIALTANAIKGEKERCLEIGMNDYMSKPFEEKAFIHCCSLWLGKKYKNTGQTEPLPVAEKLYDLSKLQEYGRGSQEFVQKMIGLFLNTSAEGLTQFRELQKMQNWQEISVVAHRMKATIDNMGISALTNEIREIESSGKLQNVNVSRMNHLLDCAESVLTQVQKALQEELRS
jgi:two-component system, sensor histidine kinase